ncbi:hypothetical protein [Pectobacterium brasiliense]|uniref:hypothetical protein n=1 Tax=Pectobacterium brasiliense TaxID=180957 RepID=UPI0020BEDFF7|nr:hypothetical protein [Pectobacterium brasiliense]
MMHVHDHAVFLHAQDLLLNGINASSEKLLTAGGCFILIPPYFTAEDVREIVSLVNQIPSQRNNFFSTTS